MRDSSAAALPSFNPQRFINPASATHRVEVAISACLAGQRVRYDGADKAFAGTAMLEQALVLVPVCPEVGAGLSVPRPAVQLVSTATGPRALGRDDPTLDVTEALQDFAKTSALTLRQYPALCGYIWKSRSPSCGLGSTPLFDEKGRQINIANGIQASYIQQHLPWLHCCEESDLNSAPAIAAFVLLCRLVFDLLHTDPDELPHAHRHYHFLQQRLSTETQERLTMWCECRNSREYLAAIKTGCSQINQEKLLELFCY
jgi:uncharacterized protein YbbK (DUF523 family)